MNTATQAGNVQSIHRHHDEPFPAPLFRDVADRFGRSRRRVVLEPGATSPGMLALLSEKRCRLLVGDATLSLDALGKQSSDADYLRQRVQALIPDAGEEAVDTVFCWDLLNYLTPDLLGALAERLVAIMAPTGVLHAFMHTSHATMPQHPQRYSPLGGDRIVRLSNDAPARKSPRYTAWDLENHGKGLRVERSVMLQNGLQEYVLRVDPGQSGPREVKPVYQRSESGRKPIE